MRLICLPSDFFVKIVEKGSLESQIYIDTRELHYNENFLIVRRVENVLIEGIAICGILDSTPDV